MQLPGFARNAGRLLKLGLDAPRTVLNAIESAPYGWGEYRNEIRMWRTETYPVRLGGETLGVEVLLHLQADERGCRPQPLYVNLGGYTTSALVYGPLGMEVYKQGLNSVMVSVPGHGGSSLPPAGRRSYRDTARLVIDAVRQVQERYRLVGPVYVLGHSHGGGVAEAVAAEWGDEVARYFLLAAVDGPEWTSMAARFTRGLADARRGRILTDDVVGSLRDLLGFLPDGYMFVQPPWELSGFMAEVGRPFVAGFNAGAASKLYSVLVDTLLESAAELEACLKIMGALEASTVCLAGRQDGVISKRVILSQAAQAAKQGHRRAPVFVFDASHALFLAPNGRRRIASLVASADEDFVEVLSRRALVA